MALADESSPAFVPGAFQIVTAMAKDEAQITERFRTGDGFGWHEHHPDLFAGTERFFRPGYLANLVAVVAPCARRGRGEARGGRARRRHRLRPRRVDDRHGAGVPGQHVRRLRLPRAVDRGGPARRRARGGRRPRDVRGRGRDGVRRRAVRPRLRLRRPARHGRPGRRVRATCSRSSRRTARGWSSSRSRTMRWRTTSTRWAACSTRRRRASARPNSLSQDVGLALGRPGGPRAPARGRPQGGFTRVRQATSTPFNLVLEVQAVARVASASSDARTTARWVSRRCASSSGSSTCTAISVPSPSRSGVRR